MNAQEKELICGDNLYLHNESLNIIKNKKNIIPVGNTCYNMTVSGKLSLKIIKDIFTQRELLQLVNKKKYWYNLYM